MITIPTHYLHAFREPFQRVFKPLDEANEIKHTRRARALILGNLLSLFHGG